MTFDWQFVVVTTIAFAAALVIVRRFVPAKRRPARPGAPGAVSAACDHCETGAKATSSAAQSAPSRTQTTPVVSVGDLRRSARRH
jgi:hypothetical protein